ncbi:MAG: sortase [Roseburia sp.]|nr:sortase [Roseburia sp.]MCM1099181.1 sortase [Ruminococcus flavefaciens]
MNRPKKYLSILLAVIAAVCLIAAVTITARRLMDQIHLQNTMETLRPSEDSEAPPDPDAAGGASETDGPSGAAGDNSAAENPSGTAGDNSAADNPSGAASGDPAANNPSAADGSAPEPAPDPVVNPYRDSFLANSDMAGWLQIPDTVIDYPVMWTPENEEYYLRRGFDGSRDRNGCLILDTDSCLEPLTTNLIIHGHNMGAGTMFGTLNDYESEDFFREHRQIILYTKECQRNYEVIAVFRSQVYKKTDKTFKFYQFFQADTQEEFDDFYDNIMALAIYDTGVTAEFGDRFITLSTCSKHVEQGRFVVVAKEVESGDTYLPLEE